MRRECNKIVERASSRLWILPALAALTAGCDVEEPQSALAPSSSAAESILTLHWVLTALSTFVVLLVIGTLVYALFRRRDFRGTRPPLPLTPDLQQARDKAEAEGGEAEVQEVEGSREYIADQTGAGVDDPYLEIDMDTADRDRTAVKWVLLGGVVFPAVTLLPLFVYVMLVSADVGRPEPPADLTIEVVGWQFWWEVHYFDSEGRQLFETANEIHIPAGKRVQFELRSVDVIHSFWVPRLAGKLDMIPGRTTKITMQADTPGVYRGQCAEYCGLQHAKMAFLVIAEPEAEFREWVRHQASPAVEIEEPLAAYGREVFHRTACSACHSVHGHSPSVGPKIGPDLTHVASRQTIGAVTLPNTKGHMGGWLANPQAIKSGVNMPAVPLDNEEYLAVLHYMMSLE